MSWDFTADDLRKEIKDLREKIAVQSVKVGEQETKLLRNEEELRSTKENYADALTKLRKEADRSLELEETLKKRTEELKNEKNFRENVEGALRLAKEELAKEVASAREAQHYLSRTATESNQHCAQLEKITTEKTKLEAQVRELQSELRKQQNAPPPQPKTPARPRASSLTNLNKLAMLENDIERIRASASTSEVELKSTQEKLSKAQSDLVRAENDKAVLEKKLKEQERKVDDLVAEKAETQSELTFYREQNAADSREKEFMARLEEEEAKVSLLEQQLAKACHSNSSRRTLDQLHAQLNREVAQREAVEAREAQLVQEREEALSEVDDLRRTLRDLEIAMADKNACIEESEAQYRSLKERFESARHHATSDSMGIDDSKITDLVNGIARIRAERDELKAHLEFVQMEAHFRVEALERKLVEQANSIAGSLNVRLSSKLKEGRHTLVKLQRAVSAMAVIIQHLHAQNVYLLGHTLSVSTSAVTANSTAVNTSLDAESKDQLSFDSVISDLQDQLRVKAEEMEQLTSHYQVSLTSKDEQLSELKLHLSDTSSFLREEKETRTVLEEQVRQLEVNLETVKQKLADSLEHCERLEARQCADASADVVISSLKNEIEELRGRIVRRTEQIGLQQHDIKRLETNMRLTDERLEEVLGELEMAETAKAAMLEDCSIAREERNQAKEALVQAELEVERLSARATDLERETGELREVLLSMEAKVSDSKDNEMSASSEAMAERDNRITALTETIANSEAALRVAEEQASSLRKELKTLQETSQRSVEELQEHMQHDKQAMSELEHSVLETKKTLLGKEEELKEKADVLRQLELELEAARISREESLDALRSKEENLLMSSAEVQRLASELEMVQTKQQEDLAVLEAQERQLVEMNEKVMRIEEEKSELLTRVEIFEKKTEKELADSTSLRSTLEEERKQHEQEIKRLEAKLASLEAEKEEGWQASESSARDLSVRYEENLVLLEKAREELKEKQELCDTLAEEQRKASACQEEATAELQQQIAHLSADMATLQKTLQEEAEGRKRDVDAHKEELQTALEKQESLSVIESELRRDVQQYQEQLEDLRSNLMTLQDEKTTLQSEIDNLSGEYQRTKLKTQSVENQLASSATELSELRDELARLREALSKSEKSGKTAEINLLLVSQQHERTVTSLRNQLKEHEKDAERIQKLQQIVGETREQISEMEGVLKAKCTEIEENDDKFIQLLKEKKKLTSKVESLTKKNTNLQNKLAVALVGTSSTASPSESSTERREPAVPVHSTPALPASGPLPRSPEPSVQLPSAKPKPSGYGMISQFETPRETRRVSSSKRRRESTPPLDEIPVTTSIGKKRPLPDDADTGRASVEARLPDMIKPGDNASSSDPVASSSTSHVAPAPPFSDITATPRQRRQAPSSGFTPVRGHAASLRPTLSQPSPIRRTGAAQALQAPNVISDITNSPPRSKRVFTEEPGSEEPRAHKLVGRSWLGKIRGGTNPLLRTRPQSNTGRQ